VIGSVRVKLHAKSSPSAGCFPAYTVAEVLYVTLYEENPRVAHEELYALLEPILLSELPTPVKKALFIPVDSRTWGPVRRRLVELLTAVGGGVRARLCSALARGIPLLAYSMQYSSVERSSAVVTVVSFELTGLVDLCPEVGKYVAVPTK